MGIEDRYIISRQNVMLPQELASGEREIFHLGSLLARKHCERPEPGSVFLQLHKGDNTFFLLVDQVIDEIELPEQTTRLPPPSPELAEQLCPQVAICMNLVVLLLDPAQVIPIARQLGPGVGLFAVEGAKNSLGAVAEVVKDSGPSTPKKQIQKNKKRPKSVDEETFKRVMSWTIAQFKQGKVGTEHLAADQLPPGLVQQEGVSETVIQYLIDQISLRCQESITPGRPGEHHGG
ncbi:CheW-like domain-containing protein [Candidatus Electrothrix laxa]